MLTGLFLILFVTVTMAQQSGQSDQDTVYQLSPVVVDALRYERQLLSVPYTVEIINFNNNQQNASRRLLNEVMPAVPGIFIADRNNPSLGEKITIRGIGSRAAFGIRGIKVLSDEIPMTMPDGQTQITNIDINSAGRIEILKGPGSSLYGNAAGGVISIYTEIPDYGFTIKPQFLIGSYGLQKYNLKAAGKNESIYYVVNLNKMNYKGFRENSSMSSYHLNSVAGASLSNSTELKAILNIFDTPYSLNPSSLSRRDADDNPAYVRDFIKTQGAGEKTRQIQTGLTFIGAGKYSETKSTIYYISRSLYNPIPGRIIDLKRDAAGVRSMHSHKLYADYAAFLISAGADLELQYDKRSEYLNDGIPEDVSISYPSEIISNVIKGDELFTQNERVLGTGIFSTLEIQKGNFIFNSGIRYDRYTFQVKDRSAVQDMNSGMRVMDQVSPMAGLLYKTGDLSKVFINYATSFQTPSANELGNRPDGEGGFNPDLRPEKLYSIEAGALGFFKNLSTEISGAVFLINFQDMLIPYQLPDAGDEVFYRNAGKAENIGGEVSFNFYLLDNLQVKSSYTLMNFTFKDYTVQYDSTLRQLKNNEIPGIPSSQLNNLIRYAHNSGISAEIRYNVTGAYFTNDFNGSPDGSMPVSYFINDGYSRLDVRLNYHKEIKDLSAGIFFGINNILDKKHNASIVPNAAAERYFEPAPGRNWYAGIYFSP